MGSSARSGCHDERVNVRGVLAGVVLACLALAGCCDVGSGAGDEPFRLPVGPTRWDATARAWLLDGTLMLTVAGVMPPRRATSEKLCNSTTRTKMRTDVRSLTPCSPCTVFGRSRAAAARVAVAACAGPGSFDEVGGISI